MKPGGETAARWARRDPPRQRRRSRLARTRSAGLSGAPQKTQAEAAAGTPAIEGVSQGSETRRPAPDALHWALGTGTSTGSGIGTDTARHRRW
jgi:hypothetical protein